MTSAHTGVISSLTLYYYFSCLLTPGSLRPENGSLFLWFQVPLPWPITVSPALNPFWWPPVTFSLRENCDCDSYQPPNTHTHITWKQPREGQRHCWAARSPGPQPGPHYRCATLGSPRAKPRTNQLLLSTPSNQQLKETQSHSYGCCPGWIVGRTNKAISKEFPTCSDIKVITASDWHERGSPGKARLPGSFVTASAAVLIRNQLQVKYVYKEEA